MASPNNTISILVEAKADTKGFKDASAGISQVAKDAETGRKALTAAGVAIGAVGIGITAYAKNATDFTTSLVSDTRKLSRETGLTATEASRLVYVTSRLGIDADQASASFGLFSRKIVETAQAANPATTALGSLGVKVQNTDGSLRGFNDILLDTADRFKSMPDGPQKTAAALEIFGRSGKDMIKVLGLGSEGIRDLIKRSDELGLTLNSTTIASVSRYVQSQKDLKDSTNALKVSIGTLTAPVLTRFNQIVNEVSQKLMSTNGPFRGVITNVLAFGGPITTAAGAFLTFAANAAQVGISLSTIGAAARTFAAFMIGPWGIAITAAAVAVGFLVNNIWNKKSATDQSTASAAAATTVEQELSQTMSDLATQTDRAKQHQDALNGAQYDAVGAGLAVESAQRRYNEATKEYGPASLEARQASHDLEGAKRRLQDANAKVAAAQDAQNLSEGRMVQATPTVVGAIQLRVNHVAGLAGTIHGAAGSFQVLDSTLSSRIPVLQGQAINLQGSVRNLQGSVQNLQGSMPSLQGNTLQLQGSRASGGPVTAGKPYLVGENEPELFVPRQSGRIYNQEQMSSAGVGGMVTNIYGNIVLESLASVDRFFDKLNRQDQLVGMGLK